MRYSHKFGAEPEWDVTGKGAATGGFTRVTIVIFSLIISACFLFFAFSSNHNVFDNFCRI